MVAFTPILQADFAGTALGGGPTWTDITRFARLKASPVTINSWRQDQVSDVSPSTMTLTLDNADLPGDATAPNAGRFTPGNASSPFAAGLKSLFRLRFGVTVNGTTYWRFDGYADPLDANWIDGEFGVCNVGAADWLGLAGYMPLKSMLQETIALATPLLYLPLTDASGAAAPSIAATQAGAVVRVLQSKYGGGSFAFGSGTGPAAEGSQALVLTPATSTKGYVVDVTNLAFQLASPSPLIVGNTLRINWTGTGVSGDLIALRGSSSSSVMSIGVDAAGHATATMFTATVTSTAVINDGKPHDIALTATRSSISTLTLYVDNVAVGTTTLVANVAMANALFTDLQVGGQVMPNGVGALVGGTFSHGALFSGVANVADHYHAGADGFAGEATDARVTRLLSFRPNLGTALDSVQGTVGLQQIAGQSLQQALLDASKAEGGVLFCDANNGGRVTLYNRHRLLNPATAATLDITAQQTTQDVNIREDTQQLFNDVTITRPGGAAQRVVDTASQAGPIGVRATNATIVFASDQDSLNASGWLVANQKTPTPTVPQLVHDVLTEPQATVATTQAVLAAGPLSRVTFANRPSDFSVTDVLVQGRTDTIGVDVFTVQFNTGRLPRPTLRFDATADAFTKLDTGNVFAW